MLFEHQLDDNLIGCRIAIGKCLIRPDHEIPLRLLDMNGFPVHLKKGTPLGRCSSVSSVIRSVNTSNQQNVRLADKLADLVAASSKDLEREQQKLKILITK